jgi:uncharacterized protein (TIRG00374 family)
MADPHEEERDRAPEDPLAAGPGDLAAEPGTDNGEPSLTFGRKRLIQTGVAVVLLVAAIYVLFPKIVGVSDVFGRLGDASPAWLVVAAAFDVAAYGAYVALFRGVVGNSIGLTWRESYQVTMAALAASLLFSAGGAGGVILTYWALRKAGMERRDAACRMVAFLVLLYSVYMLAVIIDGIMLRTGVFHGPNPAGLTIVPAAVAGAVVVIALLISLIPGDLERRFSAASGTGRRGRLSRRFASVPATLSNGVRTALHLMRDFSRGGLAVAGAIGYWAANIGILWASFHGFGLSVPLGVVVMGFFVGLAANLIPLAPAGVGAVDAGMIGAFVLFGYSGSDVFPAVLTYRLFAFWLPIPPGVVAFLMLRRTVSRWEREGRPAGGETPARPHPILQKVK